MLQRPTSSAADEGIPQWCRLSLHRLSRCTSDGIRGGGRDGGGWDGGSRDGAGWNSGGQNGGLEDGG